MRKLTFNDIREQGLLLYEYVRGSNLYNINTPESDIDYGGVYIAPKDTLLGLGFDYQDEVSDEKHDTTWWEIGKFMKLLLSSNPTVLEALFVPDDKVIFEHPLFKELRTHRDEFVTKACFMPFGGYAISQIKKAQGQNKKIHWDMENMVRKTPLDFCHLYDGKQGSVCVEHWLAGKGLREDCCGLVNLPNMKDCYLLYYDYGQHLRLDNIEFDYFKAQIENPTGIPFFNTLLELKGDKSTEEFYESINTPLGGHCGIINNNGTSNTVRLCSTQKGEIPLCIINYNQDGYESHCRKYKEYEEWRNKRNKARYESNLQGELSNDPDMKYDCKNMGHCFRLVAMCTEIARGEGIKLDRTNIDRDFLMAVRARKYGYSELMEKLTAMKEVMDNECAKSNITESVDSEIVNNLLLNFRKKFYQKS